MKYVEARGIVEFDDIGAGVFYLRYSPSLRDRLQFDYTNHELYADLKALAEQHSKLDTSKFTEDDWQQVIFFCHMPDTEEQCHADFTSGKDGLLVLDYKGDSEC